MTLRTHCLKRILPNIESKRVHLPLGPSKVGNFFNLCRMMPLAAISSRRLMNACRASELLFGSPHRFFTRRPSPSKGRCDRSRSGHGQVEGNYLPCKKVRHCMCGTLLCEYRLLSVRRHRICENVGH